MSRSLRRVECIVLTVPTEQPRFQSQNREFTWRGTDFVVYKVTWSDRVLALQAEREKVGED